MHIDRSRENLLVIQYPPGGFGFYIARLINSFVTNVVRTADQFEFDKVGSSHLLPLVAGDIEYQRNRDLYDPDPQYWPAIQDGQFVVIPHCPGMADDSLHRVLDTFPNAAILRVVYHDSAWPLVFQNCIIKAKLGSLAQDVAFASTTYGSSDAWAVRENYTLVLQGHDFRNIWKPIDHHRVHNLDVYQLLTDPVCALTTIAKVVVGEVYGLETLPQRHQQFLTLNQNTTDHLEIYRTATTLPRACDLGHIQDLYQQAVFNFYVQSTYDIEIPVNDYSDWFINTDQVLSLLSIKNSASSNSS